MITKKIQKVSLYPTPELFKEYLEEYVEKGSAGYINDIKWDSQFYSEYMQIVSIISDFFAVYFRFIM